MNKLTLLIDLDDVIYPFKWTPPAKIIAYTEQTALEHGYSKEEIEKVRNIGIFNCFTWILRIVKGDLKKYDEICKDIFKKVDYSLVERDDSLYQLFEKISEKYNTFIATNNSVVHADNIFYHRFGRRLDSTCFKCIDIRDTYGSDGEFHLKQIPGNLKYHAACAHADPKDCILLDDSKTNVANAIESGMKGIQITEEYTLRQALEDLLKQ